MDILNVETLSAARAKWFCRKFTAGGRPRFVLGRNKYAVSVARQVSLDGFVDDFATDAEFLGKPIVKLDALPGDALVLNCVPVGRPITAQRRIDTFGYDQLDYYAFLRESGLALEPIDYWVGFTEHFQRDKARYDDLFARLADPFSREVLSRLIRFRLTYDLDAMRPFSDTQARQYFENFIAYGDQEIFADIGAYDGITSHAFAARRPDYKGIYVFEPNDQNLAVARRKLGDDPRVHFVAAAVGASEGTASFNPAGSSSRVTEGGSVTVKIEPLDKYGDVPFTFLKMDIEGAESSAIAGARGVIEAHHPRMAISVYHNPGDMVDIPRQVLEIRDDYELRLRHYTEGFTETVMYFLPRK